MSDSVPGEANEPGPDPHPGPGRFGVGQAFFLFAVVMTLLIFVGAPLQAFTFEFGLPFTLIVLILLPAIIYVRVWHQLPFASGFRLKPVRPAILVISLLAGIGGWSVAIAIYYLQVPVLGPAMGQSLPITRRGNS